MAGTTIVAVRRLRRPGPRAGPAAGSRPPGAGHPVIEQQGVAVRGCLGVPGGLARLAYACVRLGLGGTRPGGRSQMGGWSSPHRSSRAGPSSSSTPGSENTGAPSGTGVRPAQPPGRRSSARAPALAPGSDVCSVSALVSGAGHGGACSGHGVCSGRGVCSGLRLARAAGAGGPGVRARAVRLSARRSGARAAAGPGAAPTRCRPRSRAGESAATGKGPVLRYPRPGTRLAGTGGLEARAARAAVARLGRAQGPARWLRRQRGGPGSVRLAGGRGHRRGRSARGWRAWPGRAALAPARGSWLAGGCWARIGRWAAACR